MNIVYNNPQLKYIILCGKDTKGHYPGDALISLIKNGIDDGGKIIGHCCSISLSLLSIKKISQNLKNKFLLLICENVLIYHKISKLLTRLAVSTFLFLLLSGH